MDIEQGLLAAILTNDKILNTIEISPEDFISEQNGLIFESMLELSKTQPIDLITLTSYLLNKTGKDYMPLLKPIVRAVTYSSPNMASNYAEEIKTASRASQRLRILSEAIQENTETDEVISKLMALQKESKKHTYTLKESMKLAYSEIEAAHNGVVGFDTGYKDLNKLLGGWRKSDLYIIGARPAMGKTALMINFARLTTAKSLIISGEQPAAQVAMRLISQIGNVKSTRLRNASMEEHEWSATAAVMTNTGDNMIIYDKPNPSITDIIQQARRAYHEHEVRILFVDYIQKIRPSRKHNTKAEEVAEVAEGLKIIARELQIPVIALAQVNREAQKQADKRPSMAHLKDSGTIEQEADAIAMLYRDSVYNENADKEEAELNFEKNRHGPIGMIKLKWKQDYMRFEDEDY